MNVDDNNNIGLPNQTTCPPDPEIVFSANAGVNVYSSEKQTQLFTAAAVHDLKGHLQLIASGISLFRRRYQKILDGDDDRILDGIDRGVERMNRLINDILLFSTATEERHRLALVDLNEVAQSVVASLRPVIEMHHAIVSIGELPVVCGDEAQLYDVFLNLISNALKYRKPGVNPKILMHSHLVSRQDGSSTGDSHEIVIEDNGIGFTNEQAGSLFQSFQRLNNPGIEGSGLGLAICRRIIVGHRGNIRAEGQLGVGAKFIFQLPSTECCEKGDQCPFAASSYEKKCPALKRRS